MAMKADTGKSLVNFTDDVGIPERLMTDGVGEFTGKHTEFIKHARHMRILLHTTESGQKNQNYAAEGEIGTLAKQWKLRTAKKEVPKRLWDFGLVYESKLLTRMARGSDRCTGYEEITGQTPDISKWMDFEFYDLVWWIDCPKKPNVNDEVRDLSYWLITESGKIILKTSVEHVICDDYLVADKKEKIDEFNCSLEEALDGTNFHVEGEGDFASMYLDDVDSGDGDHLGIARELDMTPSLKDYDDMITEEHLEADEEDAVDKYLNAELIFNVGTNDE